MGADVKPTPTAHDDDALSKDRRESPSEERSDEHSNRVAAATLRLRATDAATIAATGLLEALNRELLARYPGAPIDSFPATAFDATRDVYVLGEYGAAAWPAACGALRALDPESAEVKRMYVIPALRRRGLSRAVLGKLEDEARLRGHRRLLIETGYRQPEAIALYRHCGYAHIAPFGGYVGNPVSVCFAKIL